VPDRIEIAPPAAHPECILTLARWFEDAWPAWYGPGGPGNAVHDLEARCRHSGLPFALVAHCGGELGGTAALTPTSIASHAQLGPWLSGLLVAVEFRRRGIAGHLVAGIEEAARELGHGAIFTAIGSGPETPRTALLQRHWTATESTGNGLTIYVKPL